MIRILKHAVDGAGFHWNAARNTTTLVSEALDYLLVKSSAAYGLIHFLESVGNINLLCTEDTSSTYFPASVVQKSGSNIFGPLVTWNPYEHLEVSDIRRNKPIGRKRFCIKSVARGMQSPALGLAHECGHARQDLIKHGWFTKNYNLALDGNDTALLTIENDNLLINESVIARQLGESIRWRYRDIGNTIRNDTNTYNVTKTLDQVLI